MAPLLRPHCSPRRTGEPYLQYLTRYKTWKNWRDQRNSDEYRAVQLARLPTPDGSDDDHHHDDDRAPPYQPSDQSCTPAAIPRSLNITTSIAPSGPPSPTESMSSQEPIPNSGRRSATPPPPVKPGRSSQNTNNKNKVTKQYGRCLRSRTRLSPSARHFFELDSHGRPCTVEQSPVR